MRSILYLLVAVCASAQAKPPMPTSPEIYGLTPAIWDKIVSKSYAIRLIGRQQLKSAAKDYLIDEFKSLYHWGWEMLQGNLDRWIEYYGDPFNPNSVADAHLDIRSHLVDVRKYVETLTNDCEVYTYKFDGVVLTRAVRSNCLRNFGCPLGAPIRGVDEDLNPLSGQGHAVADGPTPDVPLLPSLNSFEAAILPEWGSKQNAECVYGYMPPAE